MCIYILKKRKRPSAPHFLFHKSVTQFLLPPGHHHLFLLPKLIFHTIVGVFFGLWPPRLVAPKIANLKWPLPPFHVAVSSQDLRLLLQIQQSLWLDGPHLRVRFQSVPNSEWWWCHRPPIFQRNSILFNTVYGFVCVCVRAVSDWEIDKFQLLDWRYSFAASFHFANLFSSFFWFSYGISAKIVRWVWASFFHINLYSDLVFQWLYPTLNVEAKDHAILFSLYTIRPSQLMCQMELIFKHQLTVLTVHTHTKKLVFFISFRPYRCSCWLENSIETTFALSKRKIFYMIFTARGLGALLLHLPQFSPPPSLISFRQFFRDLCSNLNKWNECRVENERKNRLLLSIPAGRKEKSIFLGKKFDWGWVYFIYTKKNIGWMRPSLGPILTLVWQLFLLLLYSYTRVRWPVKRRQTQ